MVYTVMISIPEIDELKKELENLKNTGSVGALTKEWYSLKDLSVIVGIPYSTFLQNKYLHPKNPYKPRGKRSVYHHSDVKEWLDLKKGKEQV